MAVVNELVTKFVFKGTLKPLKNLQTNLRGSIVSLAKYTTGITLAATATFAWVNSTLRASESILRLSQDTDISIKKLQQYQFIAAKAGVTNDSFTSSIISLSDKIGEAATQGNEDFNRLGVSVRDANGNIKNTDVILNEVIASFSTLDAKQRINFANKLGIDRRLITALSAGDEQLNKLIATANKFGLLTEKQTKTLDKYFASTEILKFGFSAVSRQIALSFAPSIIKVNTVITNFLADFGKTFTLVFGEFFGGVGLLLSSFSKIIEATIGWKTILIGLGVAFAIAFPVTIVVAAVIGILAAVEDLIVAFKGGKSVIADFFQGFGIDIVQTLTDSFLFLENILIRITKFFAPLLKTINTILAPVGEIGKIFGLGNIFTQGNIALDKLTGATSNTTQTMSNTINIEVRSNDPQAAAQAVSSALTTQLEQASFQFGKGGQ